VESDVIATLPPLAGARSLNEAWHYLFGAPGWRPDGKGLTIRELRARAAMT
jgi:hypothetical protein